MLIRNLTETFLAINKLAFCALLYLYSTSSHGFYNCGDPFCLINHDYTGAHILCHPTVSLGPAFSLYHKSNMVQQAAPSTKPTSLTNHRSSPPTGSPHSSLLS